MDVEHMNKDELRRAIRRRRVELSCGEKGAARSRRMQERLLADELWRQCRRVALFVSVEKRQNRVSSALPEGREGRHGFDCLRRSTGA